VKQFAAPGAEGDVSRFGFWRAVVVIVFFGNFMVAPSSGP
jgi:hypothetical protein